MAARPVVTAYCTGKFAALVVMALARAQGNEKEPLLKPAGIMALASADEMGI